MIPDRDSWQLDDDDDGRWLPKARSGSRYLARFAVSRRNDRSRLSMSVVRDRPRLAALPKADLVYVVRPARTEAPAAAPATQHPGADPFFSAAIDALYERLGGEFRAENPDEGVIQNLLSDLQKLQGCAAERMRKHFEGQLEMPMDGGRRALEEARALVQKA